MFHGSHSTFQLWWIRFVAFVMIFKFIEAVKKGATDVDMLQDEAEVLDESNSADKKKIVAKNRNAVAMANFSMALTSKGPWD